MRKTLLTAGLAGCLALAAVEAAQAQVSFGMGRGYGGRSGFAVSVGSPYSSFGYGSSPWMYGGGYSPYGSRFGYPAYSGGYWNTPFYGTYSNWSYPGGWRYQYPQAVQTYGTWSTPGYSAPLTTSDSYVQGMPQSGTYTSFYSGPPMTVDNDKLLLTVQVPSSDARLWIDGKATQQRGFERTFVSPSLDPGTYTYSLKATWDENGREVTREKQVRFQPGRQMTVAFDDAADRGASPRTENRDPPRTIDRDFNRQPDAATPRTTPDNPREADRKPDPTSDRPATPNRTANPPVEKDPPKTDRP
jgi:uncharacterized protein (TIGR03000 family)